MFWPEIWKYIRVFLSENFQFRPVFVMLNKIFCCCAKDGCPYVVKNCREGSKTNIRTIPGAFPWIFGNRGIRPFVSGEQGNKSLNWREQENKGCFFEHRKSRFWFGGTRENGGTREQVPPLPPPPTHTHTRTHTPPPGKASKFHIRGVPGKLFLIIFLHSASRKHAHI